AVDVDDQRRAEGAPGIRLLVGGMGTFGFPEDIAGSGIERRSELIIRAVVWANETVFVDDRRTGRTGLVVDDERFVFPKHAAGVGIDARGPVAAEMSVDLALFQNWRGRGKGVPVVKRLRLRLGN